jgi:hypothetical protein
MKIRETFLDMGELRIARIIYEDDTCVILASSKPYHAGFISDEAAMEKLKKQITNNQVHLVYVPKIPKNET